MAEAISLIGQQLAEFYYATFDSDRSKLASLYRPESMLSWEGEQSQGVEAIMTKLKELPFTEVKHKIQTVDTQPSSPLVASVIVAVSGFLQVDGGEHPLQFNQTFQLIPDNGTYWIFNDIFRLNYG